MIFNVSKMSTPVPYQAFQDSQKCSKSVGEFTPRLLHFLRLRTEDDRSPNYEQYLWNQNST
ncbi:hypothetical protein PL8927_750067 [Planktothrix serta PCC 8927]|uniref:Uncharacterized protein n=2 Tax=Planktothrix TaxID=54304 RepID=A0A7Z9BTQ3_9CYAN|nr:hypothetical protein PL8927_750067 [Planktothrix serta PCC 8927]